MLLWTFIQGDEETIPVHQAFSEDDGHSWGEPTNPLMEGQVPVPLALLPDQSVMMSYYDPGGKRRFAERPLGINCLFLEKAVNCAAMSGVP